MLQYFRYNNSLISDEKEYKLFSGIAKAKYIFKRIVFFIFMFYSVFFLAVATPYVKPPYNRSIYVLGFIMCFCVLARLIACIIYSFKFTGGSISLSKEGISTVNNDKKEFFSNETINFIELDLFSNLKINVEGKYHIFPAFLLGKENLEELLKNLEDVAPKRTSFLKKSWELVDALVMALILAVHIIQYCIQNYYIPSGSMEDTLKKGDHLFAEKLTYGPEIPQMLGMDSPLKLNFLGFRNIQRGDIVIFKPPAPADENKDYIKRCIAVAGDELHIANGKVYVNGKPLVEPYVKGHTDYTLFPSKDKIEGVVPEGHIVVLGDNRENSQDSRYFGYVNTRRVKSRAFILYWHWDHIKKFDFSRFGLIN